MEQAEEKYMKFWWNCWCWFILRYYYLLCIFKNWNFIQHLIMLRTWQTTRLFHFNKYFWKCTEFKIWKIQRWKQNSTQEMQSRIEGQKTTPTIAILMLYTETVGFRVYYSVAGNPIVGKYIWQDSRILLHSPYLSSHHLFLHLAISVSFMSQIKCHVLRGIFSKPSDYEVLCYILPIASYNFLHYIYHNCNQRIWG